MMESIGLILVFGLCLAAWALIPAGASHLAGFLSDTGERKKKAPAHGWDELPSQADGKETLDKPAPHDKVSTGAVHRISIGSARPTRVRLH